MFFKKPPKKTKNLLPLPLSHTTLLPSSKEPNSPVYSVTLLFCITMTSRLLYTVVTTHNAREASMGAMSIRITTQDPSAALACARSMPTQKHYDSVSMTIIYAYEEGKPYEMTDMIATRTEPNPHLVYLIDHGATTPRVADQKFMQLADIPDGM